MFALVIGAMLAGPPALPEAPSAVAPVEPAPVEPALIEAAPVEAAPVEAAPVEASPAEDVFVITAAPVETAPVEPARVDVELAPPPPAPALLVTTTPAAAITPVGIGAPHWAISRKPPWSGSGRFVGGSMMLVIGTGVLVAATFEFADGRDTTKPMISNIPGGISALVAGGVMIGTAVRDQQRLGDWEATQGRKAAPSGNGLIVGGVTMASLGGLAAIATSIASEYDLDAPRSLPAGWATAGVGLAGGVVMIIAGSVRRHRYERAYALPTLAPTRAGASVGITGRF